MHYLLDGMFRMQCVLFLFKEMEESKHYFPNRIEISQFGATFLRGLPGELSELEGDGKENSMVVSREMKRRGQGIDFREFARETQALIRKEVGQLEGRREKVEANDSKRKQLLHHDNWVSEQKLVRHKLLDTHSRLQQLKYSEYDWKSQREKLVSKKSSILSSWECSHLTREKRMKSKLRKMLHKKYPNRAHYQ